MTGASNRSKAARNFDSSRLQSPAAIGYKSAIASMNLNDTQKIAVREWIDAGLDLSKIQSKLSAEFGVRLTYMEVRFLVDDLGVVPRDAEAAVSEKASGLNAPLPGESQSSASLLQGAESTANAPASGVSITVDQITRAGALASGRVTFSNGKGAAWSLDQLGRLGLSPDEPGYKPPQEDVMNFQVELQKKLSSSSRL